MLTIGTLGKKTGTKVQTIRYYEQIGLMTDKSQAIQFGMASGVMAIPNWIAWLLSVTPANWGFRLRRYANCLICPTIRIAPVMKPTVSRAGNSNRLSKEWRGWKRCGPSWSAWCMNAVAATPRTVVFSKFCAIIPNVLLITKKSARNPGQRRCELELAP